MAERKLTEAQRLNFERFMRGTWLEQAVMRAAPSISFDGWDLCEPVRSFVIWVSVTTLVARHEKATKSRRAAERETAEFLGISVRRVESIMRRVPDIPFCKPFERPTAVSPTANEPKRLVA